MHSSDCDRANSFSTFQACFLLYLVNLGFGVVMDPQRGNSRYLDHFQETLSRCLMALKEATGIPCTFHKPNVLRVDWKFS